MVLKELSLTKILFLVMCFFAIACSKSKKEKAVIFFEKIDLSQIPNDTIFENNKMLKLENGIYYFDNKPFSGYIRSTYSSNALKSLAAYFKGNQHGTAKAFYPNGKLKTQRNYKNGLAYGRHWGYWENGNKKFDFTYFDDRREGLQKQWYESGNQYSELRFANDKENGLQKAWRENGKAYINYEVKEGVRYGLQKSALCYTLRNEKIK